MSGSYLSPAEIYYKICKMSGFRVFITRALVTQLPLFEYKIVAYTYIIYTYINIFIVPGVLIFPTTSFVFNYTPEQVQVQMK